MRYKVNVSDLRAGMYVSELDRSWVGTPFLFQGFLIESNEELNQLKATCVFVIIDEAQSEVAVAPVGKRYDDSTAEPSGKDTPSLKLLDRGTNNATLIRKAAQEHIGQIFASARQGADINIKESHAVVERLVQQSSNLNLMMQLVNLRSMQDRNAAHSMNTAVLAIAFGRHLGHSEDRLRLLGLGALLHDIGKTRIPAEILDKPAKLTDAEFTVMKHHPAEGFAMLSALDAIPSEVLDMVHHHHERANGSGYPNGLQGDGVPLSVSIIAIVDAYETLTADKPYQLAITPVEALQRMRNTGMEEYGKDLMQEFVRFFGLYPVGSLVKLSSGDIAVVFASDPSKRLRPLVIIVLDGQGIEIRPHRLVNLAGLPIDKLSISGVVDPRKYAFSTSSLFEAEMGR